MKKALSLLAIIALASCTQVNSNSEKTITKGEDTISDVDISLSKMDVVEELSNIKDKTTIFLKASGTEPGWFAEFYPEKIRLVLDYGKDSVILDRKNDDLSKKEDLKIALGKSDEMVISNKPCTNSAGEVTDKSITITYKTKKYQGCGSLSK